jgi:hypothetical protein
MIVYCRCKYANVLPRDVKDRVLGQLVESQTPFEAVPDLCHMAAQGDPDLANFSGQTDLRIAACYPRTIVNLFRAAGSPLRTGHYCVGNMREQASAEVVEVLQSACGEEGASR